MRRRLSARHDRFALSAPFRISRGVKTAADVVTVTLREGELEARGEGVPYARYGESVESVLAQIAAVRGAIDGGINREELLALAQCTALCDRLLQGGVEDLHFYTLNRDDLAYALCMMLGVRPQPVKRADAAA
mgnify:CR=1 FL=1